MKPFLKRTVSLLCSFVLLATMLAGCAPNNDVTSGAGSTEFPVTINEVTVKVEPQGVAVLSPNLAEIILAMGYEIKLKAKSADCTQDDLSPLVDVSLDDPEAVKNAGADLALTSMEPTQEQKDAFSANGITLLTIPDGTGREELIQLYAQIGAVLKGAKTGYAKGEKTAKSIFMVIDDISRVIPVSDTPITVCYLLDAKGGAVTGDTMQGKLIEAAGLTNAATDGSNNVLGVDQLMVSDPHYIFCPQGLKDSIAQDERLKELTAVKEGRVFEMNPTLMRYQGRGMIQAVSFMAGTVYPELLEGVDVVSSAPESSPESAPATSQPASSESTSTPPASLAPPASSAASTPPSADGTVKKGDENDAVLKLQNRLEDLGYLFVKKTGFFGDGTEQSLKNFQLANGLSVTGIGDPATLKLLYSDQAKKNPNPGT